MKNNNTNKRLRTSLTSLSMASLMALSMLPMSAAQAQTPYYNSNSNAVAGPSYSNSTYPSQANPRMRNRHAMSENEIGKQYYLYIEDNSRQTIQDFFLSTADLREGGVIRFVVDAQPYARVNVTFTVSGVIRDIALSETESGRYTGSYTIRRTDVLTNVPFTAKARKGSSINTAQLIPPKGGINLNVAASGQRPYYNNSTNSNNPNSRDYMNRDYGVVKNVEVQQKNATGINVPGSVIGAVVGGVVGNQIGGGDGNKAATILGALGGGYAGNKIGQSQNKDSVWIVTAEFNDRTTQTYTYTQDPGVSVGMSVRREGSNLFKR